MTTMTHDDRAVGGTSIWQRLSDLNANLAERRAQHRTYRSTVSVLNSLSNRELLDIGIHPADIHDIARQGAYGA